MTATIEDQVRTMTAAGMGQRKIAAQLRIGRDTVRRIQEGKTPVRPAAVAKDAPKAAPRGAGKSFDEFRAQYDRDVIVPGKIRAALKALGNTWEYEANFARAAGVSSADLGSYRDQFAAYWVQVKRDGRKVWSGSRNMVEQMRKVVG